MTKADLVDHIAATMQLSKPQTEVVITGFSALHAGERVPWRGFGNCRRRHRQPRAGRNPPTGDTIQILARTLPACTTGKSF